MLLCITALAAAAATSPPFKTAVGLRPAARGLQDFAECPVLTKIKKDDCTDVKDFDALPVCSDPCLCKGMHCRAEATEYCGSEDKGSGHHNCAAAASLFFGLAVRAARVARCAELQLYLLMSSVSIPATYATAGPGLRNALDCTRLIRAIGPQGVNICKKCACKTRFLSGPAVDV